MIFSGEQIRLRQIINLRDTVKSRYFGITEFNNYFIIRPPRLPVSFSVLLFSGNAKCTLPCTSRVTAEINCFFLNVCVYMCVCNKTARRPLTTNAVREGL